MTIRVEEQKNEHEASIREAIHTASRVEAGTSVMPGIFQTQFVLTEITKETLSYVYQQGLDVLLTHTSVLIPEIDGSVLSVEETSCSYREYGDYVPAKHEIYGSLTVEPEISVSTTVVSNSELFDNVILSNSWVVSWHTKNFWYDDITFLWGQGQSFLREVNEKLNTEIFVDIDLTS